MAKKSRLAVVQTDLDPAALVCRDCRHWHIQDDSSSDELGQCRFNPPSFPIGAMTGGGRLACYPIVTALTPACSQFGPRSVSAQSPEPT